MAYLGNITSERVLVALVDGLAVAQTGPHVNCALLESIPVGDLDGLANAGERGQIRSRLTVTPKRVMGYHANQAP